MDTTKTQWRTCKVLHLWPSPTKIIFPVCKKWNVHDRCSEYRGATVGTTVGTVKTLLTLPRYAYSHIIHFEFLELISTWRSLKWHSAITGHITPLALFKLSYRRLIPRALEVDRLGVAERIMASRIVLRYLGWSLLLWQRSSSSFCLRSRRGNVSIYNSFYYTCAFKISNFLIPYVFVFICHPKTTVKDIVCIKVNE